MRTLPIASLACCLASSAFAQDWAKQDLTKSPRHQEWLEVKRGDRTLKAFVVHPEMKGKTPAVIIIHENMGLTDWVRDLSDQIAAAGYIAVAPDLLSGMAPGGGKTSDFPSTDAAREAIYKLDKDAVTADLNAVADLAKKLPDSNGKIAVAGFCWGGGQSFRFATARPDLSAAFVFYGPPPEDVSKIRAPVYGFYGGNDARIGATIPAAQEAMKKAGKTYEPVTYQGAGHGFLRAGQAPDATPENKKAREDAWKRWTGLLRKL
jgi:carboxymethylenebutenolidase